MARNEARLAVSIWSDQDFLALSPTAQRMFMFLTSQSDLAYDGVLALRVRRWSKTARGLTVAQITADLAELSAARFVVVDEDTEELLIRSFIRRDEVYRQPNILRSAARHLDSVSSSAIRSAVATELIRIQASAEDIPKGSMDVLAELIESLGEPISEPQPEPFADPLHTTSAISQGEGRVVTEVSRDAPLSLLPNPDSPLRAAASGGGAREGARKRGTRLPDDFAITDELKAWFAENCRGVDGPRETEKFRNYWRAKTGKDATKIDWPATWRNWMLTAAERAGPSARGPFTGATRHTSQRHDNPFAEQS
jgi:hypothetical protein